MAQALYARLIDLLEPVVQSLGLDLVEIEVALTRNGGLLRLYIDGPSGISLDDCERTSRAVTGALDVEDPIQHAYRLEVSSPGPDRPVRKPGDFERYRGRFLRVRCCEPVEGRSRLMGRLTGVAEEGFTLEVEGSSYCIPWPNVEKARLVPED